MDGRAGACQNYSLSQGPKGLNQFLQEELTSITLSKEVILTIFLCLLQDFIYWCHYALVIEKFCMSKTSCLQIIYLFLKFYTKPMLKQIYQIFKSVLLSVRKWQLLWLGEPHFSSWCYYFSLLTYPIFCSMTNQNFQHDPCPFLCIGWRMLF